MGIRHPFRDPDDDGDFWAGDWVDEEPTDEEDEAQARYEEAWEYVHAGAKRLDKLHPGWADLIDPNTLDIADTCKCVIGQLYEHVDYDHEAAQGSWEVKGWVVLNPHVDSWDDEQRFSHFSTELQRNGFQEPVGSMVGYDDLLRVWREAIEQRVS